MCTYHLCFTGQIKFLNYNKIPQQGESIGNEASPKPHAGTASSSGGTIEESLVSLTLVDLATVRDTVKLKDLLLSSLVNLRSPLVHVAGNNSPLVHFWGVRLFTLPAILPARIVRLFMLPASLPARIVRLFMFSATLVKSKDRKS